MADYPDIVFIVLDTQRADRLGCYGYDKKLSPNLDQFAAEGTLFNQAVAPAQWTIPSHASMFTGVYPTAHQVTQASQSLPPEIPHLVELLQESGYDTVGFCNNPLVGILNNGFKRGFDTFYNYGGAVPSVPGQSSRWPWPLNRLTESYTQFLRRISYPIQNYFSQSDLAFRISLNAWLTPLWSKFANFKGQNARSVKDVSVFLREREQNVEEQRPLFLFLNLMETHMPFTPPAKFVDRVDPSLRQDKEARAVMQRWNREAFRWASPLAEPLSEIEQRVLNTYYDAEVAYQDDYLGQLFETLNQRRNRDNTFTIIVADHGDGLGEHGFMGHAFNAYEELIHVPLMMQWPRRLTTPRTVATPVSTRRVFHTILDAVGKLPEHQDLDPVHVRNLTLLNAVFGRDPEQVIAYSEVYPPLTFIKAIRNRNPHLLEAYNCLATRRALIQSTDGETVKLIEVEEAWQELYNLGADPLELENLVPKRPLLRQLLQKELNRVKTAVAMQQKAYEAGHQIEMDDQLAQRLRGLGYLD